MSGGDGFVLLRRATLAWLLERARADLAAAPAAERAAVPDEVARDLQEASKTDLPAPLSGDRIRAAGPLLSVDEHVELVMKDLDIPRAQETFARTIVGVVHAFQANEAEAVLRVMGAQTNG